MNSVLGIISILGILLLTQGCSSSQKVLTQDSTSNNQTLPTSTPTPEQVKEVKSTKAVPLAVKVQDQPKTPTTDDSSNKQMHLVVVSDDLRYFQHETPIYKAGKFEINPDFPAPGNYTVFSDYSAGSNKQVTIQKIKIPGNVPLPTELEKFSNTKTVNNTLVLLSVRNSNFQSGQQVNLSFNLQDTKNNQPVKDLRPYPNQKTNEKARLFIVRSSSPLKSADYIPATPLYNSPDGQVSFISSFPTKGTYKLWLQFNRNGKLDTADFWLDVK
ncbi:hypothetical protein NIES4071_45790 [Calothrix sp. NIES-4071]|nr:hypothetical protein NIES4071_45790 [Calothrix sp. NIES-4071]BAZ58891.1 hypothetical protein NIES4105_45720 [Calothrix sp. NIES-4105]